MPKKTKSVKQIKFLEKPFLLIAKMDILQKFEMIIQIKKDTIIEVSNLN